MRTLSKLTIVSFAALTLGVAAAHAQSPTAAKCGVETWSTDKMTYVSTPCDDQEKPAVKANAEPAATGTAGYCAALLRKYDQLLNRDSRLGAPPVSLDARAGAEKCRAGDASGIAPLEKALQDARIELPKRS